MNASTPHILVVEDDHEIGILVAKYLRTNEYRVTTAKDAREMDCTLAASRIDLLVLDLNLPGEDGLSICRRLRAQGSPIPIVMLTAKGEEIDRIIGLEMGADDYLPKPFNPRELLARIKSVLRRRTLEVESIGEVRVQAFSFAGWQLNVTVRELFSPQGAKVPSRATPRLSTPRKRSPCASVRTGPSQSGRQSVSAGSASLRKYSSSTSV